MQIRPIEIGDTQIFFSLIENNRKQLETYFPITVKTILDCESALRFVEDKVNKANSEHSYYFVILRNNKLLGIMMLKDIDWSIPKSEIGYYIDKSFEGEGIMSASIQWLINKCFNELGLNKLFARINPQNISNKKVLLKNGFSLEGLLKNDFRNGVDALTDSEYYGIINAND
jgi:RimJ/RimL family protein N-acetyltransferase